MVRNRDEFSQRTRTDLALRASYVCSLCKCSTVGPIDEPSNPVTGIGGAAHTGAAAPGRGARRYDPHVTVGERSHIDNGIWLCANCSVLVDRDEERFTPEALIDIKRKHERSRRLGPRAERQNTGTAYEADGHGDGELISIGNAIVILGNIIRYGPDGIRVRVIHFVDGSARDMLALARDFASWPAEQRFVLFNELGFGGRIAHPPSIERSGSTYELQFEGLEHADRARFDARIVSMCAETGRRIEGMDAHVQNFERTLGMARGTSFANLAAGSELSDLYWRYEGSRWFATMAKAEMIRLSSIAASRSTLGPPLPPFRIVTRVNSVGVAAFELVDQMLGIAVEFELEGMGAWRHTLQVFISTPEQMIESREQARAVAAQIKQIEQQNG